MHPRTNPVLAKLGRRLRLGVVGGGPGSFIGEIHRSAARLDDCYEIVAAVLSSDPDRSRAAGQALGLPNDRAYATFSEMITREPTLSDGIEVVAIMTPNAQHHPQSVAALNAGLHVLCDKPLTTRLEDSHDLVRRVRETGLRFCTTYNYTGYPMVRQARAMVRSGELGEVRLVQLQYVQGHLAPTPDGKPDSSWRFDPEQSGPSLILGDIGVHAHHLGAFVTGLHLSRLCADVGAAIPGREADDSASLLLRYSNGARGVMWTTQAAAGAEHGLAFRVHGDEGGLEWRQENPNYLRFTPRDRPAQILTRGGPGLRPEAQRCMRVSIGHPEGFHEAFANLYTDMAETIAADKSGTEPDPLALDFPGVEDGARGVEFVYAAVDSQRRGSTWVECPSGV